MKPMLANPLEVGLPKHANQWTRSINWPMQAKLDGVRAIAWKEDQDRPCRVTTRTEHDITGRLPVVLRAHLDALPPDTILDGELGYVQDWVAIAGLYWPILDFNSTMRVLGSSDAVAQQKIETYARQGMVLQFFPFDILMHAGHGMMPYQQQSREDRLDQVVVQAVHPEDNWMFIPPQHVRWNEELYTEYVDAGGEGVMLKNPLAGYIPGRRPTQAWYKVKKFDTTTGVIVGYDPGKGKYDGQVGALVVQLPQGVEVRVSGMTDAERLDLTDDLRDGEQRYLNKKIDIRFFGNVGQSGEGIRHPQFIRMRPDLDG